MFRSEQEPERTISQPNLRTRFTFDSHAHQEHHTTVQQRYMKLSERISDLSNEYSLNGMPIIKYIFQAIPNPDPAELELVGEALVRISKLLPAFNEAKEALQFISYALSHPNEAMLAFADASNIAEQFAQHLTEPKD